MKYDFSSFAFPPKKKTFFIERLAVFALPSFQWLKSARSISYERSAWAACAGRSPDVTLGKA